MCTRYAGLFSNPPDEPVAGLCVDACDPLTPVLDGGTGCAMGQGCYLLASSTDTIAVCAGAGSVGHNQLITGPAYANSCVPGASPRTRAPGSTDIECGGLCVPAEVTSSMNLSSEGGAGSATCQTRWGAAPPADGAAGESCRYFWFRETFAAVTPYSNTVGFCFKHAAFLYDSDGDLTPDAPWPRCTSLTTGDVVPPISNPAGNDAQEFGCLEKPTPKRDLGVRRVEAPQLDRLTGWR